MAKKSDYPVFEPFNPLDKRHLGASVANALLESDTYPLPPDPFIGAGVYALYYIIISVIFPPMKFWRKLTVTKNTPVLSMLERLYLMGLEKAGKVMMLIPELRFSKD